MAAIFLDCPVHGRVARENFFGGTGRASVKNSLVTCPVPGCGLLAPTVDGTYEFAKGILQSFREASRSELLAFRELAEAVERGTISKADAAPQVASLSFGLQQIWNWTNDNAGALSVVIAILALLLAYEAFESSNQSSVLAHEDALNQQSAIETQTQVVRSEQEMLQKTYEALERLPAAAIAPAPPKRPQAANPQPSRPQTPGPAGLGGNRHDRRKAACLERRGKKR